MKILDVPQRGSRGNIVASRNRAGAFHRERVSPNYPCTAAQCRVWGNMTTLSRLWNEMSDERRAAWRRLAVEIDTRPSLGKSGPLDGTQLFKKVNSVLWACGRELLFDPPPLPQFGPNPVEGFVVRKARGRLVFKLRVSGKVRWEARSPLEDLMVYGWAPCNAGADKNDLYTFLGLLRPPANGESDITEMYLAKLEEWRKLEQKRYRVPLEGSRIFIRVWQQVNGWENQVGMFRASALVPFSPRKEPGEWAAGYRKGPVRHRHQ